MQVGTTKDQGLYNKPSAAVHPGALVAGTLPQYNTMHPLSDVCFDCIEMYLKFILCTNWVFGVYVGSDAVVYGHDNFYGTVLSS